MTVVDGATTLPAEELLAAAGERTLEVLRGRRHGDTVRRRGWLVRRMLLGADIVALVAAFVVVELIVGSSPGHLARGAVLLAALLPLWVVLAKASGLYQRDEERATHTTTDDLVGVFNLMTAGAWIVLLVAWALQTGLPHLTELIAFWALGIAFICVARAFARSLARHSVLYVQNLVIVGAGNVGQLVARKVLHHPEYGINLVGFVDAHPRARRAEVDGVAVLGSCRGLADIVRAFDVDRVVVAFSEDPTPDTIAVLRELRDLDVQIDVVPRLFDLLGPNLAHHSIEALPLTGIPPIRLPRSSRLLKRLLDICGALVALLVTWPLFVVFAVLIKLDSPGPVLFRQQRLGIGMKEFTALKFRTMTVGADDAAHRDYIRRSLAAELDGTEAEGIYKLQRPEITKVGAWLRKTSLDELPQLLNVLRGDMSLVGPRPCIAYETEHFSPHHFERFLVPAGLTGLWQVTARAKATFSEALDMDVAYARGWSLGLDLSLLCRTPAQVLRSRGAA
jgi:exopolysaccharide biosynthesis polyprenyl glycosylphosphotransferase